MSRAIRRLMFVNDATTFGGAERYTLDMVEAAARRGIEPSIWRYRWPGTDEVVFGASEQTPDLITTPARGGLIGLVRDFRAVLRAKRPDAIVINASPRRRFWATAWVARQSGIPAVWVEHLVEGPDHRRLPPGWLGGRMEGPHFWRIRQSIRHQLGAAPASAVITSSEQDRDRIARRHAVSRRRIFVIPPGADCHRFQFSAEARERLRRDWGVLPDARPAPFVVGTAARLVTRKRIACFIEALAMLRARSVPAIGVIAGDGPERGALARTASERGIADAVRFLGGAADMVDFYSALDAFALCSETESFGLVLTEAMACERTVVSTPTAGAHVQIRHLENGWQLGGFSAEELADALAALHENPSMRDRLGAAARRTAANEFTIDQTLDRTLRALSPPVAAYGSKNCSRNTCHFSGVIPQSL